MAKVLKMRDDEMRDLFTEGIRQTMRMNYYPPCPQPEKVIGLTPHSDGTGLSILLQINDVEGLQIMKDGKWIPVKPLPNAFVVNIGDIMEVISYIGDNLLSNNRYCGDFGEVALKLISKRLTFIFQ